VGCEYITIENITGITGDDTVALTALPLSTAAKSHYVEGKKPDIHDITIRNIISASHGCSILRFLCEDGSKEYNITVDGIKDTGEAISSAAILFGESATNFCVTRAHCMGEFDNVTVRNVTTCAQRGLSLSEPISHLTIENLTTYGPNEIGIMFSPNFVCEDLTIRNVVLGGDPETADCLFSAAVDMSGMDYRISHVRARSAKYIFRRNRLAIDDFRYEAPSVAEFTPEKEQLCSAYGRYHFFFYGKEIMNRPKDNRFAKK